MANLSVTDLTDQFIKIRTYLINSTTQLTNGNVQEAEDLVSEAYLRILISGFKEESPMKLRNYFILIIKNINNDKFRKYSTQQKYIDKYNLKEEKLVNNDQKYDEKFLLKTIDSFPDKIKKVVHLRITGLLFSEIGKELGITEQVAKNRMSTFKNKLEKILNNT